MALLLLLLLALNRLEAVERLDMREQIKELVDKRAQNAEQANQLITNAKQEERKLTADEQSTFDALHADIEAWSSEIENLERQMKSDEIVESYQLPSQAVEPRDIPVETVEEKPKGSLFSRFFSNQGGAHLLTEAEKREFKPEGMSLELSFRRPQSVATAGELEKRAPQTTQTDASGGYLIPEGFWGELVRSRLAFGGARSLARVINTATGNPLPIPTIDDTANVGALLAENTAASEQAYAVGEKVLNAYKYSSDVVLVPHELMVDSFFDQGALIGSLLGERLGRIENTVFTTGDGSAKPQGYISAATTGKTTAVNSAITYAELLDLKHSVDPAYRQGARWSMEDGTLRHLKGLVDGDSRPLWQAGMAVGEPNTIDGDPYVINQDVPAIATTADVMSYGDHSRFWVRDIEGIRLVRLNERYAVEDQVAFIAFIRVDSELVDAAAIKVLTMAV